MVTIVYGSTALIVSLALGARSRSAGVQAQQFADAAVYTAAWGSAALVGATLLARRPTHPVGWCFGGMGVVLASWAVSESYGVYGVAVGGGALAGHAEAAVIANSVFIAAFVLIALACSLTPDGRYLSWRWRMASRVMVVSASMWFSLRLISPEPLERPFEDVTNPWAVAAVDPRSVRMIAALATNCLVAASVLSLLVRFVRARGEVRRQLLWLVAAAVLLPVLLAVAFAAALADNDTLLNLATVVVVAIVPVAAGLGIGRYRLYDVDRILSRAVTYVVVTGCLVATYAAVVVVVASAAGQTVGQSPLAATGATLAAVAIARPAYERVRDVLDRRFQRRRYEAVQQVRAFVADPPSGLRVETVLQEALADPGLRVVYRDETAARWVTEDGHMADVALPEAVIIERSGRIVAAVSSACNDAAAVREVLDEAAPELDNARLRAAVAVQLEEVRASRERIANAQVDERRRIERDLHDGAQQRLLGAAAQMQAALLNGTRERLVSALELGVSESRIAVAELRALANGLHPAVLEDAGLPAALADLSARLPISLSISGPQRRHPPLVEATLWFVACETVSNALKHADPRHVNLRLDDLDTELRLVVEDDGRGGANPAGAGLRGLADRVEAAGGRLIITSIAGAGTRIETVLPCAS